MCFSPGGMPGDILKIKTRIAFKALDLFFFFDKLAIEKNEFFLAKMPNRRQND